MNATSGFLPGDGVGVVAPRALILLEHAVGDVVPALVAELAGDGGIDAVLDALAAAGLRAVGSFAVAVEEGEALRVIARGDAWIRIAGQGETATFDGAGLRTWNEQLVAGWDQVTLGLGPRVDAPSLFELDRGVVPAAGLVRPNVELPARSPALESFPGHAGGEPSTVEELVQALPVEVGAATASTAAPTREAPFEPAAPEPVPTGEVAPHDSVEPEPLKPEPLKPGARAPDAEQSEPEEPEAVEPAPVEPAPVGRESIDPAQSIDSAQTIVVGALDDPGATISSPVIAAVPTGASEPAGNDYDDIFGRTVVRSVQDAAVHSIDDEEPPSPATPAGAVDDPGPHDDPGDHDGHTITLAQLREMQQAEAAEMPQPAPLGDHDGLTISVAELRKLQGDVVRHAPPDGLPVAGVTVQALVCPAGHANPTHASSCGRCGAALGSQPSIVPRPVLGRLVLSTGEVVELDRSAIVGRNPKLEGRLVGGLPKIVRLESFQGLSRSHAMVRLEGWQVLVLDLGSANHTTVTLPGRAPQRLHPDEPVLLSHGASIDFGGEVTATYESYS